MARIPQVRHYKIDTHQHDGVTYRTVQSRSDYWGPYRNKDGSKSGGGWIVAVVLLWPWCLVPIPLAGRIVVALAWYALLGFGMVWASRKDAARKRGSGDG